MMVLLHRREGGVEGIYRCVIPDTMNVKQTVYIGVYTSSSGECALILFQFYAYVVTKEDCSDKRK